MKAFKGLLVLAVYMATGSAQAAEPLFVGVLDESRCPHSSVGDVRRFVRVPFARAGEGWIPLYELERQDAPKLTEQSWTVAFDGRDLGSLRSIGLVSGTRPPARLTQDDHVYPLAAGQPLPEIRNKGRAFFGWCQPPTFRPMVLVSGPNFADPDKWKPFQPETAYRTRVFNDFRAALGKVMTCKPDNTMEEIAFDYAAGHLLAYKSYRDRSGRELLSVGLDPKYNLCSELPELLHWAPHWFLIDGKDIRHLGGQLELIDAGDYDADGKSEVIFWRSGYNEDGYTLFHDDFRGRVNFYWSYH